LLLSFSLLPASSHVYLNHSSDEEVEVAEDVLQGVDEAGGMMQGLAQAGLMDAVDEREERSDEEAVQREGSKSQKKKGFFGRLFSSFSSSSSASSAPAAQQQQQSRSFAPPHSNAYMSFCHDGFNRNRKSSVRSEKDEDASANVEGEKNMKKKHAYRRAFDTNVLAIKLGTLGTSSEDVFAGDAVICDKCGAALSHLSTIKDWKGKVVHAPVMTDASSKKEETESEKDAAVAPAMSPPGGAPAPEAADAAVADAAEGANALTLSSGVGLEPNQMLWRCDFCEHENIIHCLEPEEIPTKDGRDYVLEPAPVAADGGGSSTGTGAGHEPLLIFVLDTSGSMCVSSPVLGRHNIRGQKPLDPAVAALAREEGDNSAGRGNVTYVSRLQCVQAWMEAQLKAIATLEDDQEGGSNSKCRRVLLIQFNNDVTILGDGSPSCTPEVVAGDKLSDLGRLKEIGARYGWENPVGTLSNDSRSKLLDALYGLEESGATALGPALTLALEIARSQPSARGAQILVCTDGMANVGLGSMPENDGDADAREAVAEWYTSRGLEAREIGALVNVISIKGSESKLEFLGLAAAESGGDVERVDPTNMIAQMKGVLEDPIVATNVTVTFFLHKALQFREASASEAEATEAAGHGPDVNNAAAPSNNDSTKLVRPIGNVTNKSETTLEYGLRRGRALNVILGKASPPASSSSSSSASASPSILPSAAPRSIPFQVQLTYTSLSGMKALRVLTHAQPVTLDRSVAERGARMELLSAQVAQTSAQLARQGRYKEARLNWIAATPLLARTAQAADAEHGGQNRRTFVKYAKKMDEFDRAIAAQQRMEASSESGSDNEEEELAGACIPQANLAEAGLDGAAPPAPASSSSSAAAPRGAGKLKLKKAKAALSDESYRVLHKTSQLYSSGLI